MNIQTTRFGEVSVDPERSICFPQGVLGFPLHTEYALIQVGEDSSFFWLQATDEPALAFVVVDPRLFIPDYQVSLRREDAEKLELQDGEPPQVLVVCNKVDDTLTANLQGPIVINLRTRIARQLVLSDRKYSTRHPLMQLGRPQEQVSKTA